MSEDFIILPNPDFIHRKEIEELIKNNDGYCITQKQDDSTKCVCEEFKNQDFSGLCKCGQYYKVLKAQKVCLCGDNQSKINILRIARKLALEGYMVLTSILFFYNNTINGMTQEEQYLNEIHKAEIAEADLIYVIPPAKEQPVSDFTKQEILWATQLGKKIIYLDDTD